VSFSIGSRVEKLIVGVILAVVLLLVGVALGPTVLLATADINATALADVPMGSVIVLLGTYVGFFYYLGIVLGAISMIWATVNYS
jgi:hypothetical protein